MFHVQPQARLEIFGVSIENGDAGVGIGVASGGRLMLMNSDVTNNRATLGGGISVATGVTFGNGAATLTDSVVNINTAAADGAASTPRAC